jgi:hypothetical protein
MPGFVLGAQSSFWVFLKSIGIACSPYSAVFDDGFCRVRGAVWGQYLVSGVHLPSAERAYFSGKTPGAGMPGY